MRELTAEGRTGKQILTHYLWRKPLVVIMKRAFCTCLSLMLTVLAFSQEFELSDNYVIHEPEYDLDSLFWTTPNDQRKPINVYLTLKSDTIKHIQEFTILELETYDRNWVFSLKEPQLLNVKEIVKVEFDYMACCVTVENHYFILTTDDRWIKLPTVDYVACDGPEPFFEYRFPSQKFGIENTILETKSFPDSTYSVDTIEVLKRIKWTGKEITTTYTH